MAVKIYNKKDLKLVNGYIADKEGNILWFPSPVIEDFNRLERRYQKAKFDKENPIIKQERQVFEFESVFKEVEIPSVSKPATPLHDEEEEKALALMKEADEQSFIEKVNATLKQHSEMFEFVADDTIETKLYEGDHMMAKFDTLNLGNPLELTADKLSKFIQDIVRLEDQASVLKL